MKPDWANLEALALSLILDKLEEKIDHVWFGAVCKNWHSIAKLNHQNHRFRSNVLPMLMILRDRRKPTGAKMSLFGIPPDEGLYHFQLPMPYLGRCCGSSYGWFAIVNHSSIDISNVITLLNPFKNVAPICLPVPPLNYAKTYVNKVTLSADPSTSPNHYVIAAILEDRSHRGIAFTRAGKNCWSTYATANTREYPRFTDITFHNGLLYVVDGMNTIMSFNPGDSFGSENIVPNIVFQGSYETYSPWAYLVKSLEGNLWMVTNFFNKRFRVYELELDAQSMKLMRKVELESLGDNVLFVGCDNDSISVSASYFSNCLQKDSIYFTTFEFCIYDVKNGTCASWYPYKNPFEWMNDAYWVLPQFQWD